MSKLCLVVNSIFDVYVKYVDSSVLVNKMKDKPLRLNIWETTPDTVSKIFKPKGFKNFTESINKEETSLHVLKKIESTVNRINDSVALEKVDKFVEEVINDKESIGMSIALHEIIETVKGEVDKSVNNNIDTNIISKSNVLPVVPLSRVAANVGRTIAFQMERRFSNANKDVTRRTTAQIETLYYATGKKAIKLLAAKGYVHISKNKASIKDYVNKNELKKEYTGKTEPTKAGSHVLTVSLNEDLLDITMDKTNNNFDTANYFLNRSNTNLQDTKLGVITDMLKVVKQLTQGATIVIPDNGKKYTDSKLSAKDLRALDDQNVKPDPISEGSRQSLYEAPLKVNTSVHGLMALLNKEINNSKKLISGSEIIKEAFRGNYESFESLFGIKRSDNFTEDKKESISGQNLSKTTPLDDLSENYDIIQEGADAPVDLHFSMFMGRNIRLYYYPSVLNPHGSKHSRYSLTSGKHTVDMSTAGFEMLANNLQEALGGKVVRNNGKSTKITIADIRGETNKFTSVLTLYKNYENNIKEGELTLALRNLSMLAKKFPGVDYARLTTGLKAVQNIKGNNGGVFDTEFMTSADAKASGGTQTIIQAAGTNDKVTDILQQLKLLTGGDSKIELRDLYHIMENGINNYIDGVDIPLLFEQELTELEEDGTPEILTGKRLFMKQTVDLLFDNGKELRNLSKDPTMVFVYKQGPEGSIQTMAGNLADRIVDNLDNKMVKEYLNLLFEGEDDINYKTLSVSEINKIPKFYQQIQERIKAKNVPQELRAILDASFNAFLEPFNTRSEEVWKYVNEAKIHDFKALPAGAVLAKKNLMEGEKPSLEYIKEYGMPISKMYEVGNEVPGTDDIVLTREQKLHKPIMDVSMIHGIDSAQIYHAIARAEKRLGKKLSVITVHDQVIGNPGDVEIVIEEYKEVSKDIAKTYDTHQQVMYAILAYKPEMANDKGFTDLLNTINGHVENKKALFENQFNDDTDALIGDAQAISDFINPKKETAQEPAKKSVTKKDESRSLFAGDTPAMLKRQAGLADEDLKGSTAEEIFQELATDSEVITKFLNSVNKSDLKLDLINAFVPVEDLVTISGTDQGRGVGKKLDLSQKADRKMQIELIEHEITHANTVAYISKAMENSRSPEGREIQYFQKAIKKLTEMKPAQVAGLSDETVSRIRYIATRTSEVDQVAEFVAVMNSEPETATDIYSILSKNNPSLKKRITDFVAKVVKAFLNISEKDLAHEIDIEKLYHALANTVAVGETQREQNYKETKTYLDAYENSLGAGNRTTDAQERAKGNISYLNYAVASMLNSKLEKGSKKMVGKVHQMMVELFPMYSEVADKAAGIINESTAFGQLYHSITGEGVDKVDKADMLTKANKALTVQTAVINDQLSKFHKLLKPLSEKHKAVIGRFVTEMPLHDYFALADKITTVDEINTEVVRLEKELAKTDSEVIKDVDSLIDWNISKKEEAKLRIYNLETKYPIADKKDKYNIKVHKLLALKSIQAIGAKDFETLLENTDLVNLLKDTVMANKLSLQENLGEGNLNDSLVSDQYKENSVKDVIELKDLKRYEKGENLGWKVLRVPTATTLGIVYKPTIDSTILQGVGTDMTLQNSDMDATSMNSKYKELVPGPNGTKKLRLTVQEKKDLGLVTDWSQRLVRSMAHSMAIQETQILRDGIVKKAMLSVLDKDNLAELENKITASNIENPWVVKFAEGTRWSDIPIDSPIRAKYKIIDNASNVKGFDKEVSLVRKDISFWLMGGTAKSIFENPKYKWMYRVVKDLVSASKIGMVVTNPPKILNDNISNVHYLSLMNVSPLFVAKNYSEITKDWQEYSDLTRQLLQLQVKLVARPNSEKIKKQANNLRKRIAKNSLGDISDKGFINSLGSDLVAKNADTLSGLQADIHTALEYLLLDKKGENNHLGNFLVNLQKLGFQGEDFLGYLGRKVNTYGGKTGKGLEHELDQVHERLKTIRSEEDVVNYVSQYINSPGSEVVRMGSAMTDLTDVLAKETLYRHLTQNENMSEEDARIKVLDSFPDYKENMPMIIKQLSDVGIIMFPSFWLRIQKVIYRTARDKPVNLATELMLEEAMGANINSIIDANIVNKHNTFGGLMHTPLEPMGWGSIFPIHFYRFLFGWI